MVVKIGNQKVQKSLSQENVFLKIIKTVYKQIN